jgi:prephenate dehydratase
LNRSSGTVVIRVAFQGEYGAYSEEAATALCGGGVELLPCSRFVDVASAVLRGDADSGVLPIENSIVGRVHAGADAAATAGLKSVQEITLPIRHCLLAPRGMTIAMVQRVLSHPVAIAQCRKFLRAHPHIEVIEWYDTAGAARDVALGAAPGTAAIASLRAAQRYQLEVLFSGIEDDTGNSTSFVLVEKQ